MNSLYSVLLLLAGFMVTGCPNAGVAASAIESSVGGGVIPIVLQEELYGTYWNEGKDICVEVKKNAVVIHDDVENYGEYHKINYTNDGKTWRAACYWLGEDTKNPSTHVELVFTGNTQCTILLVKQKITIPCVRGQDYDYRFSY